MKLWVILICLVLATVVIVSACGEKQQGKDAQDASNGGVKQFTIVAKNFEFDQKEIKVNKGDKVKITLKNSEGSHSLKIAGYDKEIQAGKTVAFVADKTGEFKFECAVFCGTGHADMTGKFIVQ